MSLAMNDPSLSLIVILSLALIFVAGQVWSTIKAYRSPLSKIPGPWYAPITTLHLRYGFSTGNIWKVVVRSHEKYGTIFRLGPRQVWVSDKNAIKEILIRKDLPKVRMYAEISRDRESPGLFGEVRDEPHRRLRRFFNPSFTVSYIDGLDHVFGKTAADLFEKYDDLSASPNEDKAHSFQTNLMDDLHKVALDIMGKCSFGHGFGQISDKMEKDSELGPNVWKSIPHAIFSGLAARYRTVYVKRGLRKLGFDYKFDWPGQMVKAIGSIIDQRREDPETNPQDLLQHLIVHGDMPDTGMKMQTRNIIDQMSEILLAGSETTSGTIGSFFLELTRNPDVKRKLLKTLPICGPNDPVVDGKTIRTDPQYAYLNACIKENLRMHPIASEMGRQTGDQWVQLMGYDLPPHTVVSASYRSLHLNEDFWPQADRFWPERWLSKDQRDGAPAPDLDAYYPFSGGKHSCIGKNFAWAEMRVVTANLLSRFDVEAVPGQKVDFRQFITMQFERGSWNTKLTPRWIQ